MHLNGDPQGVQRAVLLIGAADLCCSQGAHCPCARAGLLSSMGSSSSPSPNCTVQYPAFVMSMHTSRQAKLPRSCLCITLWGAPSPPAAAPHQRANTVPTHLHEDRTCFTTLHQQDHAAQNELRHEAVLRSRAFSQNWHCSSALDMLRVSPVPACSFRRCSNAVRTMIL